MIFCKPKILVLGASSYIGQQLYKQLGPCRALGTHNSNKLEGTLYFDATEMEVSAILPRTDAISHCFIIFAEANVDACKADLKRSRNLNVVATKKIIDSLVHRGIKPIFMSSEYVFDGEHGNYSEQNRATPNTVYGNQKREIEMYLQNHCRDYAILRLAKVYGTDPDDHTILSNWTRQIHNKEQIICASDQVFSAIHIEDAIAASISTVSQDLNGIFHLAGPNPHSRLEMLEVLVDQLQVGANIKECLLSDLNFLDKRPLNISMDSSLIQSTTGLKFRSVEDSCREFLSNMPTPHSASHD